MKRLLIVKSLKTNYQHYEQSRTYGQTYRAGVEFDPDAKKADLEALLPVEEAEASEEAATPPEGETEEGLEVSEDAEIEVTSNPSRTGEEAVDVIDMYGNYIRTYEGSRHGKDFMGMAQEFCSHPDHAVRGYHTEPANPDRMARN